MGNRSAGKREGREVKPVLKLTDEQYDILLDSLNRAEAEEAEKPLLAARMKEEGPWSD